MKNISKILVGLVFFNSPVAMGGLFSTNVYLINKTNVPLVQDSITTKVFAFPYKKRRLLKTSIKKRIVKINPGEKKMLFSVPRIILSPKVCAYEKSTVIRKIGTKTGSTLNVLASRNVSSRFGRNVSFLPMEVTNYWVESFPGGPILQTKKVPSLVPPYTDLHITALPNPGAGIP